MKRLFAYFFLILFVGLSFQQTMLFGVYLMNKEYITKQFCINIDKPELKCNGKCHLKDAIAQQDETEQSPKLAQNTILPVFFSTYTLQLPLPDLRAYKHEVLEMVLLSSYESKMFQPPQS